MVFSSSQKWRDAVIKRLEELIRLERGWDGYDGVPVSLENVTFALRMLEAICAPDAPAPQLVPGSSGDLQIEWHVVGGDIELHVQAPHKVNAWRTTINGGGRGEEIDLTNDFSTVATWVRQLTEPDLAPATAAA
jgi:hypothetical protein